MKVALIADRQWLGQEQPTLRRLVVGLIDEGTRVVRVEPEVSTASHEPSLMTDERVTYRPTRWNWTRDWQLRSLRQALSEAEVDLLHAMDGSLAYIVGMIGGQLNVPTVCSVWSAEEIERLPPSDVKGIDHYTAGSEGLTEATAAQVPKGTPVHHVPPGVYASAGAEDFPPLQRVGESMCCIVIGNGRYDVHYRELLKAIAETRGRLPGAMFFFTGEGDQHRLWRAAEDLDLLESVSLMPTGADTRSLMMQADLLIQPQPLASVRTAVVESLAALRPLLAAADPMVDHLIHDTTAKLIEGPDAHHWRDHLEAVVQEPDEFVRLGREAGRFVATHFSASAFVTRMGEVYDKAVSPALPFA